LRNSIFVGGLFAAGHYRMRAFVIIQPRAMTTKDTKVHGAKSIVFVTWRFLVNPIWFPDLAA
jgi:hypothetical protein